MLSVENVFKTIEEKSIIHDLCLNIQAGDNVALIGPNGAGKTTTMKMIMGLLSMDKGRITMDGFSVRNQRKQYLNLVGYVPDEPFFYEELKGEEFLRFTADLWGEELYVDNENLINETIDSLDMRRFLGEKIHTYSLGMKKKLSLLIALIHQPKLLVMDEPFNGLDPMTVYAIKDYMKRYVNKGNAVLISTHMLDAAEHFCTHVAILKDGHLLSYQKTKNIKKQGSETLEAYFVNLVKENEK
ncbi:ABC transporter ATP-binding protein [Shouchella lonarensis]|uniref:ABC-2 type transport system ATP-binding protein n=1 Tax=Shouchella lonarensis TaxID=1464122 RepID=A0A1G6GWN7_9BACI|nr:ABC transporter ATP-binding protein [Shouchella lonarensis]SDB85546.1 ABC-2 type transport system ATP-binding protein [Shouchella lonarensis]